MGNHEWCDECGENNFHRDRPCDPAKKAAFQAEREGRLKLATAMRRRAVEWAETVKTKDNIDYTVDAYGNIVFSWLQFK